MKTLTLRQKFTAGLATVSMVALVVAWGNSLMGMSARFHYDERNHLAHLMRVGAALILAAHGAPAEDLPGLGQLLDEIDAAIEIHVQDDAALAIVEKQACHLSGYGGVYAAAAGAPPRLAPSTPQAIATPGRLQ